MYTCYIQSFKILASFCSWAGWFEYYLVESPRSHIFAWRVSNDITDTQTKAPDGFDRDFPHKQYGAKYGSCQNIVHLMSTNVTMCKNCGEKSWLGFVLEYHFSCGKVCNPFDDFQSSPTCNCLLWLPRRHRMWPSWYTYIFFRMLLGNNYRRFYTREFMFLFS